MARELPFKDLEEIIHKHRDIAQNVITNQYMLAKATKISPDSEYVQREIYKEFCQKTEADMEVLKNLFYHVNMQRDKSLREYVFGTNYKEDQANKNIGGVIGFLKEMKGNEKLELAHFVQTMARDIKTGVVYTRTVEVNKYYSEKDINTMMKEEAKNFFPKFVRPNKETATLNEIEVLSISNVTGLYDPKKINKKKELFDNLEYEVYSRVKTSEREMRKFVDWMLGLRKKSDYPYDAIALRIVVPNDKRRCGDSGEQMYACKDFVDKKYKRYGEIISKNLNTEKENEDVEVEKLNKNGYIKKNFTNILTRMREVYNDLKKKNKGSNIYEPNKDQKEALLQYMQFKHYISTGDRAEIQIMNKEMNSHFIGEFVGHTSKYIWGRDKEREEYLEDPSKSDAWKDIQKREERTLKNKNRTMTREKHLEQIFNVDDYEPLEQLPKELHNLRLSARLVEDRYRPVFAQSPWNVAA